MVCVAWKMQPPNQSTSPQTIAANESVRVLGEDEQWFAVHTLPFGEARAENNLKNQGFQAFMPKRQKTVRHARKLTTVEAPFFPRYLFVVLDTERDQWRKVNGTFGVARLVMRGDKPQPVPSGVIEALIASADARSILHLEDNLKLGSTVRLLAGPFADQLAILEHLDDSGRVRVLADILGRQILVSTIARNLFPLC
jgi:transcription elongation factor/antiterminator RfaH